MTIMVVLIVAAASWLLLSRTRDNQSGGARAARPARNPFCATSIGFKKGACQAVEAIGGKRFLVAESPFIPLSACTAEFCNCTYIHHDDRRDDDGGGDRRTLASMKTDLYSILEAKERRVKRSRRKSDWSVMAVTG